MQWSPEQQIRYQRHFVLPELGQEGQKKLQQARVLVVGLGGLGCPSSLYLTAAGIGQLGLVDFDRVELSNLQRQTLYSSAEIGEPKVQAAYRRLHSLNSEVEFELHETALSSENVLKIIRDYDLVLDGSDNFQTRYLVNDACVLLGRPNVYASIFGFEAQLSFFGLVNSPCFRCLYPQMPARETMPNCAEAGVLGVLPATVGSIQATEALKWIISGQSSLLGKLLVYDARSLEFQKLAMEKKPDCPVCSKGRSIEDFQKTFHAEEIKRFSLKEIEASELASRMQQGARLLDVRSPAEFETRHIEGAYHIPLSELSRRTDELKKDSEWVLYCEQGMRSRQAAELLQLRGFRNITQLRGGFLAWQQMNARSPGE